ncbi:protein kinase [Actinomadura sp. DC4]|uniref:protein kinase domain-containing protein n=1 Tax=Actinomadura sp. DC4 TaxID=3055069 RepID=UPI0025B21EEB|nr:protein kinase [Actinomadura sp. DC4]MDN3352715.1 protein kinase [Actinomadura sp. DC4]
MPDTEPLRPDDPARLGPYTLTGRLGRGGYGVVYLAEPPHGERVAIKLLQTALAETGGERERFAREAAAAKQVARFCTAQVLDADFAGDRPYIVSEYVPGPSLQDLVAERGPLEGGALDRLAIGTATALVAIHQAGVVHRDFKPPNVLMGPDGPRVIDFGIARMMDRSATLTGHMLGTPAYMAPEQVSGGRVTPAVDVFAWGATLVFAANGMPPFGRDSIAVLAHRIIHEPPELGALTGSLRALVAECLDKDPARRPDASMLLMRLLGHTTVPVERQAQTAILAEGVTAAVPSGRTGPPTRPVTPAGLAETRAVDAPLTAATVPPPKKSRNVFLAVAGLAAALALAGTVIALAALRDDKKQNPVPGPTTTVYTSGTTAASQAVPPRGSSPRTEHQAPQPTLTVTASDCDLGTTGTTCTVTLTGGGAPLHWTASVGEPLSLSVTSGSLDPGETVTVTVTLHPATPRADGAVTVTFTGGGRTHTVRVTWEGEPAVDPSSS